MIKCMATELSHGQMVEAMLENLKMTKEVVLEYTPIKMVTGMKVTGKIINKMETVF